MYTRSETQNIRDCDNPGCTESLTIEWGARITEELAIQMGEWLTVSSEVVTPKGIRIAEKTFCSTSCLKQFIDALIKEYEDAESRAIRKRLMDNTPSQ